MNSLSSATGNRTTPRANLKRQRFFHQGRRTMVEADPALTPERREAELTYHDGIIERLRERLIDPEGH